MIDPTCTALVLPVFAMGPASFQLFTLARSAGERRRCVRAALLPDDGPATNVLAAAVAGIRVTTPVAPLPPPVLLVDTPSPVSDVTPEDPLFKRTQVLVYGLKTY